jgi:hypothetical protein
MYIVVKMRDCEVEANEAELAENCVAGWAGARLRPSLGAWRLSAVNRKTLWLVIGVKHGSDKPKLCRLFHFQHFA